MRATYLLVLFAALCGAAQAIDYGMQTPIMVDLDTLPKRLVMAHVAKTFKEDGFVRQHPFELSPRQMANMPIFAEMKAQAEVLVKDKTALASLLESEAALETQSKAEQTATVLQKESEEKIQSLRAEAESLMNQKLAEEERLRSGLDANEERKAQDPEGYTEPELVETEAETHVDKRGILDTAAGIVQGGRNVMGALSQDTAKALGQKYEDCMACRFVWKQVEMDVSNARYVEDVQASFEHNCLDAQKSVIFFKACEDMYDDMYAMTDDYMANDYTVDQMCVRAKMCFT